MSDTAPSTGKKSLVTKLASIITDMERVPKSGRNEFHKYDYVTEADLVEAVRTKLGEHGVFLFTSVESVTKNGDITDVVTLHTFADGETGETFQVRGYGQGQDKADKGGYKAMTGAMKYAIMKNFLVSTGDDPERDDGKAPAKAQQAPAKAPPAKPAPPKEPLPPSLTMVMEDMSGTKDKVKLQGTYVGAFRFAWKDEDAQAMGECYVANVCRLNGWMPNVSNTKLMDPKTGEVVADVLKGNGGQLKIQKVQAKPEDDPAEKEVAETERAGMRTA